MHSNMGQVMLGHKSTHLDSSYAAVLAAKRSLAAKDHGVRQEGSEDGASHRMEVTDSP